MNFLKPKATPPAPPIPVPETKSNLVIQVDQPSATERDKGADPWYWEVRTWYPKLATFAKGTAQSKDTALTDAVFAAFAVIGGKVQDPATNPQANLNQPLLPKGDPKK